MVSNYRKPLKCSISAKEINKHVNSAKTNEVIVCAHESVASMWILDHWESFVPPKLSKSVTYAVFMTQKCNQTSVTVTVMIIRVSSRTAGIYHFKMCNKTITTIQMKSIWILWL